MVGSIVVTPCSSSHDGSITTCLRSHLNLSEDLNATLSTMPKRSLILLAALAAISLQCTDKKDEGSSSAPITNEPTAAERCQGVDACITACDECGDDCSEQAREACFLLGRLRMETDATFSPSAAVVAYARACKHGHGVACASLGLQVQDGRGVAVNKTRASELYALACQEGVGVGCFNRALMHQGGVGFDIDTQEADRWFQLARKHYEVSCGAGDLQWCLNLGVLYESGYGVPADAAKAHEIYMEACDAGHGDSCANAALMEIYGEVPSSEDPLRPVREACERGEGLPCGILGKILIQGLQGAPDAEAGLPLLDRACRQGQQFSCGAIAALLSMGDLVPVDLDRAAFYEERACALGGSTSCLLIGLANLPNDSGRAGDPARAVEYIEKACNIGHAEGCMRLAALVHFGRGADADPVRARGLMVDACRLGLPDACLQLLAGGQDLPLPPERSQAMRELACREGIASACQPGR